MAEGIDIYSANQTVTSWPQVKAADIAWCYQKVSDGTGTRTINPGPFAGVLQGGYHFSQPGSPVDQANLLVNRCELYKLTDLNPALDLEDNPPNSGKANIPNSQKASFAIAFGHQVNARGYGFTLYAGDEVWKIIYSQLMKALPDTFRWVARYRTLPPDTPYDAWQYTSSGSCPGIRTGSLDRSRGKTPLNSKGSIEVIEDKDLDRFMQRLYDWRDREGRNLNDQGAQNGWDIRALTSTVNALKDLIVADDANDVTAEAVANALAGIIQTTITPAVTASVDNALKNKELNVDIGSLRDSIVAGIKELTFKAV